MSNVKVYNLPAGTGKTHQIVEEINDKVSHGEDKILYITYTNRAKDEAKDKINQHTPFIQIETTHSFVHDFLKDYLREERVVSFVEREVFKNKNRPNDNGFYQYNLKTKSAQGEIGHDDLIKVFAHLIEHQNFIGLQKHLLRLFDYVYIDEFQDLNLSFILNMIRLYNSDKNHLNSKLFIYGDTTQEIYDPVKSYREEKERYHFEEEKMQAILDYEDHGPLYNYRSSEKVINLLNKFRGDPTKKQAPSKTTKTIPSITPSFSYDKTIDLKELENYIVMFGTNRQKYSFLECTELFKIYEGVYGYNSEISFDSDVLLNYQKDLDEHNPDPLINFVENVFYLRQLMQNNRPLGELMNALKAFPFENKSDMAITKEDLNQLVRFKEYLISSEFEQLKLAHLISKIEDIFKDKALDKSRLWNKRWESKYQHKIQNVHLKEFASIFQERERQQVSTLHGSKGESHDNVLIDLREGFNIPGGAKQYVSNAYTIYRALDVMKKFSEKQDSFTIHRFETVMKELSKDKLLKKKMCDIYRPICKKENREEFDVFLEMRRDLYTFNLLYVSFSRAREHVHISFSKDYKEFKDLLMSFDFEEKELKLEGKN